MRNDRLGAFFALLRAGLWEQDVRLLSSGDVDLEEVYRLANEQSVVGLVMAGLEHVQDHSFSEEELVPFMGRVMRLEKRNAEMNELIASLDGRMREAGIRCVLVKGQGIAQCYERPQWRAPGDVDLFLDSENYDQAKSFLRPLAFSVETEGEYSKHLAMRLKSWDVELHGTLRCGLSRRMDHVLDEVQADMFEQDRFRVWRNGETDVLLPAVNEDIVFVFTHFIMHFFKGGLGLRQICDWCRLLWTYRASVDYSLLSTRLKAMGLVSEWKAFAAYAVDYLGMPGDAMPLYDSSARWRRKADRINDFVLEVGNFGHNRDQAYFKRYPYLIRKVISFWRRISDLCGHAFIFPLDSLRFMPLVFYRGFRSAINGE